MTECHGWHVTVATFIVLPFAFIFVGTRTYMKARVVNAFWWDDCKLSYPSINGRSQLTRVYKDLCFAALLTGVTRDIGNALGMSIVPSPLSQFI